MSSTLQTNAIMVKILIFCLVAFAFGKYVCVGGKMHAYKTIETHVGSVRGRLNYTLFRNNSYYSFLGIPYAEKPINDLRFKVRCPYNN